MTRVPKPAWVGTLADWLSAEKVDWIGPADTRYDDARLLYNRMHDLRPALIVRTLRTDVLARVVQLAAEHGVTLAVRGGGHHVAGFASCDGGIVLDFTPFRGVSFTPTTRTVEVEPGTRLGDIDRALCPSGWVVPTGTVSDTGIAGLTLGGGIGWLVGCYGLTCDHLIGADVLLADGRAVRAEDPEHADLLWALRGGGGNFGVVTRFRYSARKLPRVTVGSALIRPADAARSLPEALFFLEHSCSRMLTVAPVLTRQSSEELALSLDFCLAGDDDRDLVALRRAVGPATWDIRPGASFVAWQRRLDTAFQPPLRGYWKANYTRSAPDLDTAAVVEAFRRAPGRHATILIEHLHGAFRDTGEHAAAFPLRWASFGMLIACRWQHSDGDAPAMAWVRRTFAGLGGSDTSAAYSNYTTLDDPRGVTSFAGGLAERLRAVKHRYDPTNLFRRNHNIAPRPDLWGDTWTTTGRKPTSDASPTSAVNSPSTSGP
jgi:FAD/FMN-containing dehydrogenase